MADELVRVTRWPSKMVITSKEKEIRHVPLNPFLPKLNTKNEQLLFQHAKAHSKQHVNYMRQLMLLGIPFKEAHRRARLYVGK
jgi:hypothetical protein